MRKNFLTIFSIFLLLILCTACGKEKNLKKISFSGHDVSLEESKDQLRDDFGNFMSEDGDDISLLDENKGNLSLSVLNNKIAFIKSEDKNADYNGLKVGASIKDVSNCLDLDKNFIGNNSSIQVFYDNNDKMLYKTNKEAYSTTSPIPSESEIYSKYSSIFFKNFGKIKKSKYMIEIYVHDGKVNSIALLSSSAYLKLTKINTVIAGDKVFNLNTITRNDMDVLLGDDSNMENDDEIFTYRNTKVKDEYDNYAIFKGSSVIGELDFNKKDNTIYVSSHTPFDLIINNLYIGETVKDVSGSLGVSEGFLLKNNDIIVYYGKNGKILAKYDNGKAFLKSSDEAPTGTTYQLHVTFANNRISSLNMLTY